MPTHNNNHHHPPQDRHNHHHANHNNIPINPSPPPAPKPNPKLLSLLLKAIIMAFILSLFLLFLGVAAIALLHILLAGTSLHRRRQSPSSSAAAAYSVEELQKYLPRLKYAAAGVETERDCAVCLERLKEGEWCRSLPVCKHIFHVNCVDTWLTKVPNCPMCRARVRLNSEASASVITDDDCKLLWAVGI